jgi:hypothetical protein
MAETYDQKADRDIVNIEKANTVYLNGDQRVSLTKKKILMLVTDPEGEEKPRRRTEISRVRGAKNRARSGDNLT